MRDVTIAIALLLLAGFLLADIATSQTMIPLPAFTNTYSGPTHTRGFYFQAPLNFTIVGLRVPDETKHGKQNVAVINPAVQPPVYPTTATGGLQFFKGGEPSANIIPCQVSFKKNDWVCILGACGDASNMYNSYGNGTFQSNVLGTAVTLNRFLTQTNIAANKGVNAPYSGFALPNTYSLARVEVYVASAILTGSGSGAPGTAIDFTLSSPIDAGLPYQLGSSFGNGPIPIDTRSLGLTPDDLLVLSTSGLAPGIFKDYAGLLDAQGSAKARLNIPNIPVLKGIRIYSAFVTLKATAPSSVSSISNTFLFSIT